MMKARLPLSGEKGFSLVELAVVVLIVALVSAVFFWRLLSVDRGSEGQPNPFTVVTPEGVAWRQASPSGTSALVAVVSGNPDMPGSAFVVRIKAPRNCAISAHVSRADEQLTVLQGAATIGIEYPGRGFQRHRLPAGSFCLIPRRATHVISIDAGTVLQVGGIGPSKFPLVDADVHPENSAGTPR